MQNNANVLLQLPSNVDVSHATFFLNISYIMLEYHVLLEITFMHAYPSEIYKLSKINKGMKRRTERAHDEDAL